MNRWYVKREAGGDGTLWQVVDMLSAYRSAPMALSAAVRLAEFRNADADLERRQTIVNESRCEE